MSRLPLGDLETALMDPKAYRTRLDRGRDSGFGPSYFGCLRIALLRYHESKDIVAAKRYLEESLDRFKNIWRRAETLEQFEWYVEEHVGRGWPTFKTRLRIRVPLPEWITADLYCSGEIPRVDLVPAGGYAAWLFRSREQKGWEQELQMPLIQDTLAKLLKVPVEEVQVGLYSFEERFVASHIYSYREIERSHRTLTNLLRGMGY